MTVDVLYQAARIRIKVCSECPPDDGAMFARLLDENLAPFLPIIRGRIARLIRIRLSYTGRRLYA